ncbi:hypothetical protein GCM10011575_35240 [Microlunatus endophyticus]|uniref:Uncharacterized protein n=1 Tax=Microlunatus endophyticus TaxID=1716077 RepID=A0A917SEU6_9ACTN|nr:DUF6069 family protein [Microlunatus endophyticus]GGL73846.1 hypothetical protein GCM10011575_35240 [Microlunatus endophyticus]
MSGRTGPPIGMRLRVDPVRIWVGGVATAIVAAAISWAGVVAARTIFAVPSVNRLGGGEVDIHANALAAATALFALVATALLHLLLVSTTQARRYFAWIVGLFVVGMIVEEMLVHSGWLPGLLTSAVYLIAGGVVAVMLSGIGRAAIRYLPDRPDNQPGHPGSRYHSYPDEEPPDRGFPGGNHH